MFAEVYPVDVCKSVSSCTVAITGAAKETLTVPAIVSHADAPIQLHCTHQASLHLNGCPQPCSAEGPADGGQAKSMCGRVGFLPGLSYEKALYRALILTPCTRMTPMCASLQRRLRCPLST